MPFDVGEYKIDPTQLTNPHERLDYLIDYLKKLDERRFAMQVYFGERVGSSIVPQGSERVLAKEAKLPYAQRVEGSCNSVACIAGHALAVFTPTESDSWYNVTSNAGKLLGLKYEEALRLFDPEGQYWDFAHDFSRANEDITLAQAVRALEIYRDTGKIDWDAAVR